MGLLTQINTNLLGRNTWPPPQVRHRWQLMELYSAFRRSDEVRLKMEAAVHWRRRYLISPVPRMISRAKANLLYGASPEVTPANEADADNLERILTENGMAGANAAELHRAAVIASSEEEVWGRVLVDPGLLDCPIVEFCSPRMVIPKFRGRFVVGATFVHEWPESSTVVVRLLEHYESGVIRSEVYRGSMTSLGVQIGLDSYAATAGRQEEILTGFDAPLCAFIPNSIDADPGQGYGDYRGLEQRFLAINEASTVAQENLRLAGKKRALVDAKYLHHGRLVDGDDVFVRSDDEATAGEGGKPLQVLEYGFEADQLKTYLDSLIDTTLVFAGTAPQLVGRNVDGGAISGTAQKLKMTHSLMEAAGTGGYFDRGTARLLRMAGVIDSRRTTEGGFGRRWVEPDKDPAIARGDGLPRDDMEAAQWLVLAAGAEAISLEEKVAWLHPEWNEQQQEDEVGKIKAEQSAAAAVPPGSGPLDIPTPRPPVAPVLPSDVPAA